MPIYIYKHPKREKYVEIVQGMKDKHEYTDEKGVKWSRVFVNPQACVDSRIDPFSYRDFVNKTDNKKNLKIGDLWDMASEASEKREQKLGIDPLKDKAIKDYEKKCHGKKHHHTVKKIKQIKI